MESESQLGLATVLSVCNGPSSLSRKLGGHPTPQAISQWNRVPAERVPEISNVTGVPRHVIRPDLYQVPSLAREQSSSSPQTSKNVGVDP
ncbi:YdaS family helix-turn-helix protein [uncultured Roseibium sp.]|uniref:transcriptional regulator n=1 Tax=uncultured Roseibium sp. TaxID=1936171 RepID=UPI002608FEFD|nr:YdaS family helix-turn-helix protein [uncultured Roseibium sp.]